VPDEDQSWGDKQQFIIVCIEFKNPPAINIGENHPYMEVFNGEIIYKWGVCH